MFMICLVLSGQQTTSGCPTQPLPDQLPLPPGLAIWPMSKLHSSLSCREEMLAVP